MGKEKGIGIHNRRHTPSTASFGSYLHWISHYLQSPLTAASGYVDILADAKGDLRRETSTGLASSLVRSQAVLSSMVALHQLLERQPLKFAPVSLETIVHRMVKEAEVDTSRERKRSMPLVLVSQDALVSGLYTLLSALKPYRKGKSVRLGLRHSRGEVVLRLGFGAVDPAVVKAVADLAGLEAGRYPLLHGEFIQLSVGYVLAREAGARLVVRPTSPGELDVYLHFAGARQLSLVDIAS